MSRTELAFRFTSADQPSDYQECLVYNSCEGFMIATWKNFEDRSGFYLFASYEPLLPEQAVVWAEIPNSKLMSMLIKSNGMSIS